MYTLLDLVYGVREHLLDVLIADEASVKVVRRSERDCPSGKVRWAIEIEEPDKRSKSISDRHPRVLLVYDERGLQELYGICLEQAGCEVEYAPDNDAAMRLCCEHGPYDVVLTDIIHFHELFNRIRERNPEQAIAIVGSCGATSMRLRYKIPILRYPFGRQKLVRLVESAIKPEVRILLVAGDDAGDDLWHLATSYPESYEIELESNGDEALKRYRERGPYDMVLTGFRHPGMDGSDLALAIRKENPTQRIAMILPSRLTARGRNSTPVTRPIRRKLGDIPVLKLDDLYKAKKEMRSSGRLVEGEGQVWVDSVEMAIVAMEIKTKHNKTAKKPRGASGKS